MYLQNFKWICPEAPSLINFNYALKISAEDRTLVDITNFSFTANKLTFLFGESGIGKSLINKAIYGLIDSEQLKVTVNDLNYEEYVQTNDVKKMKASGFFVFQEPSSHLNPLLPIKSQLTEGSLKRNSPDDEMNILNHLWAETDTAVLENLLKVFPKPYRPSGGEKQRFLLAMAFKKINQYIDQKNSDGTALFIFDEPSGSLDNVYRNKFIHLLCAFYRVKKFTAIVITHDYSIISEMEKNLTSFTSDIEYKELYKDNNNILLRNFLKNEYLDWIAVQREIKISSNGIKKEPPLLKMESGIKNFGVTLSFHNRTTASEATDLIINKGMMVYLKAQSGVGKTTLAKITLGLIKPESLNLYLSGFNISEKRKSNFWSKNIWGKKATMVFQHADEALNQNVTVYEVFKVLLKKGKVTKERVLAILQQLFDTQIPISFLDKRIKYLSGGQKQRINILRSLVLDTDVIIMDEPLNGLDLKSAQLVIEMIKQKQKEGKAIMMISHNEEIFDKLVSLENIYYLKAT